MYLALSGSVVVPYQEVIGIFDLDIVTQSYRTREFLARGEKAGQVSAAGDDLPKSLVVCVPEGELGRSQRLWLAQPAPATLRGRVEQNLIFS